MKIGKTDFRPAAEPLAGKACALTMKSGAGRFSATPTIKKRDARGRPAFLSDHQGADQLGISRRVLQGQAGQQEGLGVEELGVFGVIIILVLFTLLLYRLMFIAQNAPDMYGSLIVTGIFAHVALQVVLNVAVVINLIPTTGITLPFISYGGTSSLFMMAEMGIALGVSGRIKISE